LIEAEVWPNLISRARRLGIPTRIVNARLSTRSERRFRRFGALIRPVFAQLDQVLVQDEADTARFSALGVEPSRIRRTGSIKFDPQGGAADETQVGQFRAVLATAGIPPSRPTILLASTHPGEEALLAAAYLKVRPSHPEVALLVVPRHVERTAEVVSDLQKLGLQPQRRSQVTGPTDCLIIDTTGELRAWQFLATIVIVGKSFLSTGGQNPAEAVMAKKPVIFGPHMENFESLVDLLRSHSGAIQVPDTEALIREVDSLLTDPARRDKLGAAGFAALQAHEGATAQTIRLLLPG
jgi:3-deoxy-D-manno-octulosonic-acid transferase